MNKRTIAWIVCICAAIFVLSHLPRRVEDTLTVCSLTGETAEVQVDLRYHSNWIFPDYVKGTITVDGVPYLDQHTKYEEFHSLSENPLFPEHWWGIQGLCNAFFPRADSTDIIMAAKNRIHLADIRFANGVEQMHYLYSDEKNAVDNHISGISFYGPAETAEEAAEIARSLGYSVP